jgi:hypothetical protein
MSAIKDVANSLPADDHRRLVDYFKRRLQARDQAKREVDAEDHPPQPLPLYRGSGVMNLPVPKQVVAGQLVHPRCSGACNDRTICGRRVIDGSQPPLCHLHQAKARGESLSPIIPPLDDVNPLRRLKRLARSSNEQVALRAAELLLKLDERTPEPASKSDGLDIEKLTGEERAELLALVDQYNTWKRRVAARLGVVLDLAPKPVSAPIEELTDEPPVEDASITSESLEEPALSNEPAWSETR